MLLPPDLLLTLRKDVDEVKRVTATHDFVRSLLESGAEPNDGNSANEIQLKIQSMAPDATAWRIYDHCASFTRLYALYEQFVETLLTHWLKQLPQLYQKYDELPDGVRKGHRLGVAEILTRIGGNQYSHLSEAEVISGLSSGLLGMQKYELLVDAFFTYETNLRKDTLHALFTRVGIDSCWEWVATHGRTQRFLEEVRGSAATAESELNDFVTYRNQAAHGEVDEIVATEEFLRVADFVLILCEVLSELVAKMLIQRRLNIGNAAVMGKVIHEFSDRIVGIAANEGFAFSCGDEVCVLRPASCVTAFIESIEIDRVPHKTLQVTVAGEKVGLKLSRDAKMGAEIVGMTKPIFSRDSDRADGTPSGESRQIPEPAPLAPTDAAVTTLATNPRET